MLSGTTEVSENEIFRIRMNELTLQDSECLISKEIAGRFSLNLV